MTDYPGLPQLLFVEFTGLVRDGRREYRRVMGEIDFRLIRQLRKAEGSAERMHREER